MKRVKLATVILERAILTGSTDIQQLDFIYQLLGTPEGTVRELLSTFPEWDRMQISEKYVSKLRQKFGPKMDGDALSLLEKMLKMSHLERISAKDALQSSYFWGSEFGSASNPRQHVDPSKLTQFHIENGHEFERKQVHKAAEEREKEKERERKRKLEFVSSAPPAPVAKFKLIKPDKSKTGLGAKTKSDSSMGERTSEDGSA